MAKFSLAAAYLPLGPTRTGSHGGRTSCAALIDRIARHPARSIDDMLVKYEALQWSLLDDGAVFDRAVRRQVVAFRRDLIALAGSR